MSEGHKRYEVHAPSGEQEVHRAHSEISFCHSMLLSSLSQIWQSEQSTSTWQGRTAERNVNMQQWTKRDQTEIHVTILICMYEDCYFTHTYCLIKKIDPLAQLLATRSTGGMDPFPMHTLQIILAMEQ